MLQLQACSREVTPGTCLWLQCLQLPILLTEGFTGNKKGFLHSVGPGSVGGRSGGSQVTSPLSPRSWQEVQGADTRCHFQSTGKCWCWFEVVKAAGKHLLCLFEVKEENKNQAEWRRIIGVLSGNPCSLARLSVAAMERRLSDLQP